MERLNFTNNTTGVMKTLACFFTIALLGLSSCSSSKQARNSGSDDVYFSSKDAKTGSDNKTSQSDYTPAPSQSNVTNSTSSQGNGEYYDPNAQRTTTQTTDGSGNTYITNNYNGNDFNYDDYYDYAYSSRIRRFHSNSVAWSYYDPYYTNVYYYDYDPLFWGNSIYLGYSWWAPVTTTVVWGAGVGYGGWYNPYYRPWIYTNSWYYGSCGGWWNSPYYWGSGWGYNYGYGYGYGYGGWGRPWGSYYGWGYNNGYWNGYNNGYWAGYNQGLYNNYYYNSYDANTYYYGPRNSSSATGGYPRKSFSQNYEGVVAQETGSYNRFTPVAAVDRPAGSMGSVGRPGATSIANDVKPGAVSRPDAGVGTGKPGTSLAPDPVRPGTTGQAVDQNTRPAGQGTTSPNTTRPSGQISTPNVAPDANPRGTVRPDNTTGTKDLNNGNRPVNPDYSRPAQPGKPGNVAPDNRTQPSTPYQQNNRPSNPNQGNERPKNPSSQMNQDDYYRPSQQNNRPVENNNVRPGTPVNSYQDYQRGNDNNRPSSTPRNNNYQAPREMSQPSQQIERGNNSRPSSVSPPSNRIERPSSGTRSVPSVSPGGSRGSSGGSFSAPSGGSRPSGGSVGGGKRK